MTLLTEYTVRSLIEATHLSERDAKTCVYWRIASQYIDKLDYFPALVFAGPAGSGKNTAMDALKQMPGLVSPPSSFALITYAAARDLVATYYNATFLADEMDDARKEVGALLMARCERSQSSITFKEPLDKGKYLQKTINVFGATVMHLRNPLDDPARSSRSIQIFTRHSNGPFEPFIPDLPSLESIVIDMSQVATSGGRTLVYWSPILEVARQIGDTSYLAEIDQLMELEKQALRDKAEYDIANVVLARIVELMTSINDDPWQRVDIDQQIGRVIRLDYPSVMPITLNAAILQMGLLTKRRGGRRWLIPTLATIKLAVRMRNYEDEELEELFAQEESRQSGGSTYI